MCRVVIIPSSHPRLICRNHGCSTAANQGEGVSMKFIEKPAPKTH
jgi:hypothetical protein